MILEPGGYLFMHINSLPDIEKTIKSCIEEEYDIIEELKFARLRYHPLMYFHSIYEVYLSEKFNLKQ